MNLLPIVRSPSELRARLSGWSGRVALVPTMGALHAGHLSLVRLALAKADRVVVSLFVNPAQFGPQEDFDAYPRDEGRDAVLLAGAGADLLYAPTGQAMYPPGFATSVSVADVSEPLEGVVRPGHFAGVATVVAKLLIQSGADVAVFGEKDFQQLQVIRRLTRDLDLRTEIVAAPTARAADGLALSSRNAYLTAEERAVAPALHRALSDAADRLADGAAVANVEAAAARDLARAGFGAIDYFQVRAPEDLRRLGPGPIAGEARILAAARLGATRLIDNLAARPTTPLAL